MQQQSPVLLIIFNRPDTTAEVFEAIRKAQPQKLYVSADAPRKGNDKDAENCRLTREIVKNVDWPCEVHYRFLEENLGCGWGPASAISWAFEHEDRMIVLEDDCVPALPFFSYCNYLLEKYLHDTRVWLVSGRNDDTDPAFFQDKDYMFSHYGHSWGWATWKRCWSHFDMQMSTFPEFLKYGGGRNVFYSEKEGRVYNDKYSRQYADKSLHTHIWDFQFGYAITSNGGLAIVPAENLIENIGWYGTHSSGINKACELKSSQTYSIRNEPIFVMANREFDAFHFTHKIQKVWARKPLYKRIIHKSLRMLGLKAST